MKIKLTIIIKAITVIGRKIRTKETLLNRRNIKLVMLTAATGGILIAKKAIAE